MASCIPPFWGFSVEFPPTEDGIESVPNPFTFVTIVDGVLPGAILENAGGRPSLPPGKRGYVTRVVGRDGTGLLGAATNTGFGIFDN